MKLFGVSRSPYVRKIRIVLAEKRIPYEFVQERPSAPGNSIARHNPLGKVPVLVLDDGSAIYDSPVIVEYLDGLQPDPRLIPQEFLARIEVKRWEALADGIVDAIVAISHERRKPKEAWESPEWFAGKRAAIDRGMAVMAHDLDGRDFCFGDAFSLADVAAGYALVYLDLVLREVGWRAAAPNLQGLYDRLAERPSFHETLPTDA